MRVSGVATTFLMSLAVVDSFAPSQSAYSSSSSSSSSRGSFLSGATESSAGRGFGNSVAEKPQKPVLMSVQQVKDQLLELLPRMTGTEDEFRAVEKYVNILEDKYAPPQTLDFLNLAMGGEWQLLFSTTLKGGPRPNFRLKELVQTLLPNGLDGTVTNMAQWDLDDDDDGVFDCSGTFSAVCEYEINQGARMIMELKDHKIELLPGSAVPKDVQGLVGLIHRIMPTELFDPNDHAVDTTYLDGDLRIVRMTGPSYEGVRDIFIRVGSMEINPVAAADDQ